MTSETANIDQSECRKINSHLEIYNKTPQHELNVWLCSWNLLVTDQARAADLYLGLHFCVFVMNY